MSIFSKLLGKARQKSVAFISSGPQNINGFENFYDTLNLNTYKDSLYLFIAVSMIRDTVASIPLEMHKVINTDGDTEEVFDNAFLEVLNRPNYLQTGREFMVLAVSHYLLAGEAFWYIERQANGEPLAIANMRPDHVEILYSQDRKALVGYKFYQNDGGSIDIRAEDVLHFKNIDPTNPARGVGVVRPATQRIITEKEASKYQSETFKKGGRPDIAVFTDVDELTDEDSEDARIRWEKIYGGDNRSAAGFFGGNVRDIKLLGVSPKEMDYINSQNFLRDDILAALRVPKAMLTSDDVNLANSKTARINYVKEACLPVLDVFVDIINNKFLADLAEDIFISYDSPVNEDRELLRLEAKELKGAGIISVNEARALLNYPSVEGKDELTEAGNLFQLSLKKARLTKSAKSILRKRNILFTKLRATEATAKMYQAEKLFAVARERNEVFSTPELKNQYVKAFNENIDRKANVFKDTVDVYNADFLKRIVKQMEDFGVDPLNIFNVAIELQEAKRIFTPLMKQIYEKAGQSVLDGIANGFATKASEHFYTSDDVIRELEQRSEFFISSMLDTDFKEMKEIIAQGLSDGKSVPQIGQMLRFYFDDMSVKRAKTIARTETGRLVSKATNEAYHQSELVTGKIWLTADDDNVRHREGSVNDHRINDGVVRETGDATFPNGEKYPGELTINCRCALAPAV